MKRLFIIAICFYIAINYNLVYAQISKGGTPPSFQYSLSFENIENKTIIPENFDKVLEEDALDEKMGVVFRYGIMVPVNVSIENSGTWTVLPNGRKIWRLMVTSPGALAISLHFDNFHLPKGSQLFAYNAEKKHIIGAFDNENNHESLIFATELVKGETVILEYVAPMFESQDVLPKRNAGQKDLENLKNDKVILELSNIIYAYRNVGFLFPETENNSEKSCMVGVNCSEGTNWQTQKRGVARVSAIDNAGAGWCTGSLINNIENDCKPYFLLADHCGGGATVAQLNQWIFYFNYEASAASCNSETGSTTQSMTGAALRSRGFINGGSDFLLLELNQSVPSSYNPYYNGWNRGTTASPSGVSIHHPGGRNKKISTYTSTLQNSTWSGGATGAHWLVYWAQTANGHSVTAGGSSGSPIFDNNGRIVGTLTGGGSYCHQTNQPDLYGKFSYHWESNGTANNRRLRPWLDPNNTVTTLNGTATCGTTPGGLNCTNAVTLTCGQTYNGTTVGQPSNVSAYSCIGWNESGPERVHKITTSATGTITATLSNLGSNDLDVFILSSCSENACLAHGDDVATYANAPAGTYYIVVDGYNGAQGPYTLHVSCQGGTTPPTGCDTLTNIGSSESLTFYGFQNQWGYVTGHNGYQMSRYADKYSNSGTKYITHVWVPVARAHAGSASSSVTFRAWNGAGTTPGAILGSQNASINSFTANQWSLVAVNNPIAVTGNFFFGYEINYSAPQDTFAVFMAAHRPSGPNTAFAFYNSAWDSFQSIFQGNLNSSLAIEPVICTTTDISDNESYRKIKVFPNPANDKMAIDWSSLNEEAIHLEIINMIGEVIETIDLKTEFGNYIINLNNYSQGLYFISLKTKTGIYSSRFSVIK